MIALFDPRNFDINIKVNIMIFQLKTYRFDEKISAESKPIGFVKHKIQHIQLTKRQQRNGGYKQCMFCLLFDNFI
jgi:hypothetical protein